MDEERRGSRRGKVQDVLLLLLSLFCHEDRYHGKCCRSMTGSWFRSKRFRVEGAPSSLFAVLSPVKRVEEGLSPVRGAEGGLPRGALEEQRPPSLTGERREEQQSEERQEGPRYGDVKDRHEHGDDRHGVGHEDRHKHGEVEQERKPYFPSVSSSYSSTANRQGILFMYWMLISTTLVGMRTQCKISLYFQLNFSFLLKSSLNGLYYMAAVATMPPATPFGQNAL